MLIARTLKKTLPLTWGLEHTVTQRDTAVCQTKKKSYRGQSGVLKGSSEFLFPLAQNFSRAAAEGGHRISLHSLNKLLELLQT